MPQASEILRYWLVQLAVASNRAAATNEGLGFDDNELSHSPLEFRTWP